MDAATFESLVARSEARAARNPAQYRWGVFALAGLGYLYLAFVVVLLLALLAATAVSVVYLKAAAVKLFLVVGAALLVVLRALWVTLPAPTGIELTPANSPDLFRTLQELRRQLRAPRLHSVLLTSDFNAGVTQVPRFGLFGWHQNYLLVGLPLMKALTVEQFRAVLAHELGHLSGGHARAGNWIYGLRLIWARLDAAFSQTSHWGSILVRPFFKRYVPYFTATSFPLARANEYEADAASLRLTSARSAAQALTAVNIVGAFLGQKYWPGIQAAAKDAPQPAFAPFRDFAVDAVTKLPAGDLEQWLHVALGEQTSYADTHPCLTDRLKALGAHAEFSPPTSGEGAEKLLGPDRSRWEDSFDERWRDRVVVAWKQIHEKARAGRTRIAELRSKGDPAALDETEGLELASLEEEVGTGAETALDLRRALAERYPDSMPVRFVYARQLLQRRDGAGVSPMESVVAQTPEARLAGTQLLWSFYATQNDADRAGHWQRQYLEQVTIAQGARQERAKLLPSDAFVAHRLPPDELRALTDQLRNIPEVTRAWLVRKATRYFPERPLYVFGFTSGRWWKIRDSADAHALTQRIKQEVRFPGETFVLDLRGPHSAFGGKVCEVEGSRIL